MFSTARYGAVGVVLASTLLFACTAPDSAPKPGATEPAFGEAQPAPVAVAPADSEAIDGAPNGSAADVQSANPSEVAVTVATVEPIGPRLLDNSLSGGGFQSDVSVTANGLVVYSAGDVSGVHRSVDGGFRYETRNLGLQSLKVASVSIAPDNDQIVYAATGDKGSSGGLYRSTDGGNRWTLTAAGALTRFSGNSSRMSDPVPDGHPRSNGNLIAVISGPDPESFLDDVIVAGTYDSGVHILTAGGDELASMVEGAGFVRSVAFNPSRPNDVFAAIQFADRERNGIYRIDVTDPERAEAHLEYAVVLPEGVLVLDSGAVYAAVGEDGIVSLQDGVWSARNMGLSVGVSGREWTAVEGYSRGNVDVIYAATNNRVNATTGEHYSNVWRSLDSGMSWTPLVDSALNVSDQVLGQSYLWWYRIEAFQPAGLGRANSVVSSLAVVPGVDGNSVVDDVIYVAGRGGLWKSSDGGDTWNPAINNMQVTANNAVAVNPNDPNQVLLANTDYVLLESKDGFASEQFSRDKPDGANSKGYSLIIDPVGDQVVLGVGHRDRNEGAAVYLKPVELLGSPFKDEWIDTNLVDALTSGQGRVRGVAVGYHDGVQSVSQTVLAAVEGDGVYRYFDGEWVRSTGVSIGNTLRSNFVWPDATNSGFVYLLDLSSGLYRSSDGGRSWETVWPSLALNNKDFFNSGFIAASDDDPTTLFLSLQGAPGSEINTQFRVYRLTGADTASITGEDDPRVSRIDLVADADSIQRPGPLAMGPEGRLWLVQNPDTNNAIEAGLYRMDNPATDSAFSELRIDRLPSALSAPTGIDISSDGHIYISQQGVGLIRIQIQ